MTTTSSCLWKARGSAPIVGPRTLEQLERAVRATQITLGADVLERLDAIFPGPGGEAPEAYAW